MSSPAERYAAARRRQADSRTELARFASDYDFPFDDFQNEACRALEAGQGVLVAAPTGAGKTVVGEFAVHLAQTRGLKAFYTTPIKALSNQKYLDLVARHGTDRVGLLTGDTSVNPHADVIVMTTEVLRNMLYSGSRDLDRLGYVVMDEVHYLADRFRGPVWEEVMIHLAPEVQVVSLSATVSNAEEFGDWLGQVRGRTAVVVSEHRPVPLTQHMLVGRRLLPLYSAPPERSGTAQPPLNPDLLRAVREARRAAAGREQGDGGPRRQAGTGRGGRWSRTVGGRPYPSRQGDGGARAAHLRPPARVTVINALEGAELLPAIVFVFSRAGCENAVREAVTRGVNLTTNREARRIREIIERRTADIPAADLGVLGFHAWTHALTRGVAAHHAGLLPVFKETVEELFAANLVKVVYATETLSLGINMPARTVVLESLRKWNGSAHVNLTPGEYTQLTGRAGRRGIDVEGHAVVLATDDAEPAFVSSLASRRTYPLVSAFRPTYNMAVNLLGRMPRARAREVLESSFAQFQADRGVVEMAAEVRRKRHRLAELNKRMSCHLGDFGEYALLRARISKVEADQSRGNRAARRGEAGRSIEALSRGDVVLYRAGRRLRHGVVVAQAAAHSGEPRLTVVGEDRRVHTLTPENAPDGVTRVGALPVSETVDVRRPRERERLADRLLDALRAGTLDASTDRGSRRDHRGGEDVARRLEQLRHEMRTHPCHACPHREEHARVGRRWVRTRDELDHLQARVNNRTGTIARQFDAVCRVLLELEYLAPTDRGHLDGELRVTGAGRVLARVYAERDLLVAECLRQALWNDLTPAELAGAVSACVYEPRLAASSLGLPAAPGSRLGDVLRRELTISRRISDLEALERVDPSTGAEPALAGAVRAWTDGADLATILEDTDLAAGDFVRWCKQLLDVLGQLATIISGAGAGERAGLARLAITAAEACLDVNRGVVSWSSV
ncbi:RNA helicase [Actinomyces sp.]|uniref:DEAD/DEAH box helicase n=1 Tax=Actinomyces sp. TaxID=29317 RepID=UPI0026DBF3F0|nr:DEAD/DEAH box helicase [Actinomyces sp.]MDO4899680.1 DEAD/DEAH box helicase [Actinomyces sp.]